MPEESMPQIPPRLMEIYVNTAGVIATYQDIRIFLSELQPVPPIGIQVLSEAHTGPVPVSVLACVIISPEFCKSLAETLTKAAADYEKNFGAIRPKPPELPTADELTKFK